MDWNSFGFKNLVDYHPRYEDILRKWTDLCVNCEDFQLIRAACLRAQCFYDRFGGEVYSTVHISSWEIAAKKQKHCKNMPAFKEAALTKKIDFSKIHI